MKITYAIWQGSLMKGHSLTANSIKEVVKTIDELNAANPKVKFEYFISKIEQVAQWNLQLTCNTYRYMQTTSIQMVWEQISLHGCLLVLLVWFGQ